MLKYLLPFIVVSLFCPGFLFAKEADTFSLADICQVWQEVRNQNMSFHCELIHQRTSSSIKAPIRPVQRQLDIKGHSFIVDNFVRGEKQILHTVNGKNSNYSFSISTAEETPDWSIDKVVKSFEDALLIEIQEPFSVLWNFIAVSAFDVFQDPAFKVVHTEYTDPFWTVDFEIHSQSPIRYLASLHSGRVVLDSSAKYGIKECQLDLEFPSGKKVHTEINTEYAVRDDFPYPIPVKSFAKSVSSTGSEETDSYEFKEFRIQEFDDKHFTLSQFGLPEPDPFVYDLDSELQKRANKRLLLLGIGIAFIVLGLILLAVHEKKKTGRKNG